MSESIYRQYYTQISSESSKCRYCPTTISTKSNPTGSLKSHLVNKHFLMYLEEIKPKLDAKKNGNDIDAINYEEAASSNPELFIIDRENESVYPLYYNKITSEKSKCRYCPSTISTRGGSTSGLKKHLESRHKKMYLEEVKPKVEARKNGNDVNSINYYEVASIENPRKRKHSESQTASKFPRKDSKEEEEEVVKNTELMRMLQTLRSHLQTKPGVKSEWFDGLESVLIKDIENERRVQPKIGGTSHFFYAPLDDDNNCNYSTKVPMVPVVDELLEDGTESVPLEPEVNIELLENGTESVKKEENERKVQQPRISQFFSSSNRLLNNDDNFHHSMIKIRSDLF